MVPHNHGAGPQAEVLQQPPGSTEPPGGAQGALAASRPLSSPRPGPSLPGPCPPQGQEQNDPTAAPGTAPRFCPTCQGARQQNQALTSVRRARVQWGPGHQSTLQPGQPGRGAPVAQPLVAPGRRVWGGWGGLGGAREAEPGQRGCVCPHHCPLPPSYDFGLGLTPSSQ